MKSLIIINYQGTISPFVQTEIKIAKELYQDVYYLTREFRTDNRETVTFPNVHIKEMKKKTRIWAIIKFPFYILNKTFICQLWHFIRYHHKGKIIEYIQYICLHEYCWAIYSNKSKRLIKELIKKRQDVVVLAVWFATDAFVVANLKKRYPSIKAVSYAHAFEIDPSRNDFVSYSFNALKHKMLDGVYFISSKRKELYLRELESEKFTLSNDCLKKLHVSYLGSMNRNNIRNQPSNDGIFRICTCSALLEEKRIDILIEALKEWNKCRIEWQHLGGAGYVTKTRKHAEILRDNTLVHYNITGKIQNDIIHDYYKNNPVDVFLNISKTEGIPVSIMEVCSYGIPVIATDVGGTSEIVSSKNGLLIPSDITPQYIKNVLEAFWDLSIEEKDKMRKAAYEIWDEKFNADKNMRDFLTEIQQ